MPIVIGYPELKPVEMVQPVVVAQNGNSVVKVKAAAVLGETTKMEQPYPVIGMRYVELKEGDAMGGYIRHHPAPT